jgi:SpoVK/Ycf46/Vps4 family AAA+-type ATPase
LKKKRTILNILHEIVLENRKQDILIAHGLNPKNKLLFCGPPGCGKTQTAKVLSSVLGLPLVYVNLFIAATNHENLLDTAVWRRFDEVLLFNRPSDELRIALLTRYLSAIRYPGVDLDYFAAQLKSATGADIERICSNAMKSVLLRGETKLSADDLEIAIARYLARESIISNSIEAFKIE